MKALTLTQPWATLVAIGAKTIETRSWPTNHRGALAIHAAKGWPRDARAICHEWPLGMVLREAGIRENAQGDPDLPLGAIVAVCTLSACQKFIDVDELFRRQAYPPHERAFGDFTLGRYGFWLRNVERVFSPVPCRGALGIWDVPTEIAGEITRQRMAVGQA